MQEHTENRQVREETRKKYDCWKLAVKFSLFYANVNEAKCKQRNSLVTCYSTIKLKLAPGKEYG